MGRSLILFIGSAMAITIPGAAGAALMYWDGTLALQLTSLPVFDATGSGVATLNGSSGVTGTSGVGYLNTLRITGGITLPQVATLFTDNASPSIATVSVTERLGTGTLAPVSGTGPLTRNTLPIAGDCRICLLLTGCAEWLILPIATPSNNAGVGIGGTITVNGFGPGARLSLTGAPWTVAKATITGVLTTNAMIAPTDRTTTTISVAGFAHGPVSGTSAAKVGGVVQVVTPSRIETNLMVPNNLIGLPHSLRFHFLGFVYQAVPEPGLLLLLASGVAGLAVIGRYRLRR